MIHRIRRLIRSRLSSLSPRSQVADKERSSHPQQSFQGYVYEMADSLPWFGESPFDVAPEARPPQPVLRSRPYVRRVLLSMLAGRPMSTAADRAGCSVRALYNVLERVIYESRLSLIYEHWFELGLLATIEANPDRPRAHGRRYGTLKREIEEWHALLFCLVCHRLLFGVEDQPSTLPEPDTDPGSAWANPPIIYPDDLGHVQGHLAVHFRLQDEPVAAITDDPIEQLGLVFAEFGSVFGELKNPKLRRLLHRKKRSKKRTLDEGAEQVLKRFRRLDGTAFLPVRGGNTMSLEAAQRHWRSLIPNPGRRRAVRKRRRRRRSGNRRL